MAVDLVALAGVLTAPIVAGVVAVTIHRQRLVHERREGDLRQVRETLVKANAASHAVIVDLQDMHTKEQHVEERISAIARARRRVAEFFETLLELRLLFESNHPILAAHEDLVRRFNSIISERWELPPHEWPELDLDELQQALSRWFDEARAVARTRD